MGCGLPKLNGEVPFVTAAMNEHVKTAVIQRRRRLRTLAGLAPAVILVILVIAGAGIVAYKQANLATPEKVTFAGLDRTQTADDKLPNWYKGEQPELLGLKETRLLVVASNGKRVYLTRGTSGETVCLAILDGEYEIGGTCDSISGIADHGLMLGSIDSQGVETTAIAIPTEYSVEGRHRELNILARTSEVLVYTPPKAARTITLEGRGNLKDIKLKTQAVNR